MYRCIVAAPWSEGGRKINRESNKHNRHMEELGKEKRKKNGLGKAMPERQWWKGKREREGEREG